MNEFEKKVAEVISNKLNDGTVEKLIEQKLEEIRYRAIRLECKPLGMGNRI